MKSLFTVLLSIISCSLSFAQWTVDCSKLTVTDVSEDTMNTPKYRVSIYYSDTTGNHINYPRVSYLMSVSGDTLATGFLDLFAHMGPSEVDYMVDKQSSQPLPLNMYVHFTYSTGNGDSTCILEYPAIGTGVIDSDKNSPALVYPNPAADKFSISWKKKDSAIEYRVLDASGKAITTGATTGRGEVNTSNMVPGIYFLKLTSGKETSVHRIVVGK